MLNRWVCIHGHFYQPPRENPWLEAVEVQDSAYPYHDWNSRISVECYAPNSASRILDGENRIIDIVSNYSRISFNFGPTLLSWMEKNDPETYDAIIRSDGEGAKRFSGHGSAIAQCYNHMIMPLAGEREKRTQVIWGIRDFSKRFARMPEGMWLPETAVDIATLCILADNGISFTILAPSQARRSRRTGSRHWHDASGERIDSRRPYLCRLPGGRRITLFFYDASVSRDTAFGSMLDDGIRFAGRLADGFMNSPEPQLVHIATDGETYGHHHRFGEMALSYAVYHIEKSDIASLTVYGEYLERFPPTHEVEIWERSSWSCVHGIERWRTDCGCSQGVDPGWNQGWRAPLRGAMDWLSDNLNRLYREMMLELGTDPWEARNRYIDVILDRSNESLEKFFSAVFSGSESGADRVKVLRLLEMQRNAMLMYTSCGWFFDDISGIESVQVMLYAARAMQLASETAGLHLQETFMKLLERAPCNYHMFSNGSEVYEKLVVPAILDLVRIGAHYAVSSLFQDYAESGDLYCYVVERKKYERIVTGRLRLALGLVSVRSYITGEEADISYSVLHLGDHNIFGGVRRYLGEESFDEMASDIVGVFRDGDVPSVIRVIDGHFATTSYSLWHLFRDEQRVILNRVMNQTVMEIERNMRHLYETSLPAILVMRKMGVPLPGVFSAMTEFILNDDIDAVVREEEVDPGKLRSAISALREWNVEVDSLHLSHDFNERINGYMDALMDSPVGVDILERIVELLEAVEPLSLRYERWRMQNVFFNLWRDYRNAMRELAGRGDIAAGRWLVLMERLGADLRVQAE